MSQIVLDLRYQNMYRLDEVTVLISQKAFSQKLAPVLREQWRFTQEVDKFLDLGSVTIPEACQRHFEERLIEADCARELLVKPPFAIVVDRSNRSDRGPTLFDHSYRYHPKERSICA